jgi:predicted CXXCH cytochrome family protein
MRKIFACLVSSGLLVFSFIICLIPKLVHSSSFHERPHADNSNLPRGCASCHVGHGQLNTSMLPEKIDTFCYRCHGSEEKINTSKKEGRLALHIKMADIQLEFEKGYHHLIEKSNLHHFGEILPEIDPSYPRHVSCLDCHHPHLVSQDNKMSGVRGTTVHRAKVKVSNEYELCFNCHAYSANLPADQSNKAEVFNLSNPSYHPVTGMGKNKDVPSLIQPLSVSSIIKCTDCHGNDDPLGPKGPHGSRYEHILSKNFSKTDGPESEFQYELCYSCHRRTSILGDESFPVHNLHISDVGTACITCHNPHGSTRNQHLIDLQSSLSIRPSSSGILMYIPLGPKIGQCYLTCHNKDHNPETYPKGTPGTNVDTISVKPSSKSKK